MASQGDVRVLVVMNAVLSGVFSTGVVWGLDFVGLVKFGWQSVATMFAVVFALTYLLTIRQ